MATRVKAIITDAASDCRKARSLVVEEAYPHILSLDCFAHQVSLMLDLYHDKLLMQYIAFALHVQLAMNTAMQTAL